MITEDKLLLYFYDELAPDEVAEVGAALAADPELAAQYESLRSQIAGWRSPRVPQAAEAYKRRWHDGIERAARAASPTRSNKRPRRGYWMFGFAAALTAALVAGIFIGTSLVQQSVPVAMPDATVAGPDSIAAPAIPAAFTRGLQAYLEQSREDIARLPDDNADRTALTMQLIQQNRVFELAAMQSNAPNLARVLRAFEPILLQLASDDIAPKDMESLRQQLAFELKVMLTKLDKAPSEVAETI
jgi:hypothetical protein